MGSILKKVEKLNEKLEQQFKEIEKLTITKERNRVAQEIHDYLGHNLVIFYKLI
ncbi:histidine kinase [Anaerosalibacter bizertensis]|uniref:Histidine kinase n=1 Tax=Anaerosalibacter bizertensis TaxID=932217 RepID=A0A844FGH8_9FIRM|nr:histidine kinase [Anaerosalibacter bizertensis]HHV27863.1 histidine kinase [Tissierellia bacterium]